MKEYDVSLAFEKLTDDISEIIEEETIQLHNDLIDVGEAVRDTGNFKNSWLPIRKHTPFKYTLRNSAEYASILARGRRFVGGRWYGSVKWYEGITPMLKEFEKNIEKKAANVHY